MVGGIVIEVVALPDKIWINCKEQHSTSTCAIYVKCDEKSERVKVGDLLWWQAGKAMHTPKENHPVECEHEHHYSCKKVGVDYDIPLEKIGFSGAPRP